MIHESLKGQRVVVTRPRDQVEAIAAELRAQGAVPILFPTIRIVPVEAAGLEAALAQLDRFDWIVFTSGNAVTCLCDLAERYGAGARMTGRRIAAIGRGTADRLAQRGIRASILPESSAAAALAAALGDVGGARVLFPRSQRGLDILPAELVRRGATVTELVVYDTVTAELDQTGLAELRRGVDVVTVASPSALEGFLELLGDEARDILSRARLACIGPTTAAAAERLGLRVDVVAAKQTATGLVAALT